MSSQKFEIKQLQQKSMLKTVEAIMVMVAALFISAILPSLLLRYFYAGQQLLAQPKMLEYIPVIAFVFGIGYFLMAYIGNMSRGRKISQLEKEIELLGFDSCGCGGSCNCGGHDDDLAELEEIVAETLKETEAQKPAAKKKTSKAKKSTKKSSKK